MTNTPKLDPSILETLHFWPDELEFVASDTPLPDTYKGFTIGLLNPKGSIFGVCNCFLRGPAAPI